MFFSKTRQKALAIAACAAMAFAVPTLLSAPLYAAEASRPLLSASSVNGKMVYLGSYWTGETNEEGAIAEIVKYNPANQKMYLVNGSVGSLDIVALKGADFNALTLDTRVDVAALGKAHSFPSGDITSVDVNTKLGVIAIATQGEKHTDKGAIVFLDYDGGYITHFEAGVQPDMIAFSPDYKYVMVANEGEPRDGVNDPAGSVTVVDLSGLTSGNELKALSADKTKTVGFDAFDGQRAKLIANGVLLKPGVAPSLDLEPEYIAYAGNGKAYVSLEEANSIATFDIASKTFTAVKGLGYKDHGKAGNEIDINDNGEIKLQTEKGAYGVYMPDGLAAATIGGKAFVLSANEGDGRDDWYKDDLIETEVNGAEMEHLNNAAREGLDADKKYLLGARSFSIWNADTMAQVYDSGSDFERIIGENFPKLFNTDHAELEMDGRSDRKGPEPEDIKVAVIGKKTFAFIGLERAGGLMMYDITKPAKAAFYDYLSVRSDSDGALDNGSDLGAEGICIIDAQDSPNGKTMALVANEVSGSITLIELR